VYISTVVFAVIGAQAGIAELDLNYGNSAGHGRQHRLHSHQITAPLLAEILQF